MCGIWTYIHGNNGKECDVPTMYKAFYNLKHRGPDNSFFEMYGKNTFVGFHRLAIMSDTFAANQPIVIENGDKVIVFVANGEIYNHRELKRFIVRKRAKNGKAEINLNKASDCEVIPRLYMEYGYSAFRELFEYTEGYRGIDKPYIRGEFAFVLLEFDRGKHLQRVIAGRDSVGVRPLYFSSALDSGNIGFSSEMKGFEGMGLNEIKEFPPGHIHTYNIDKLGKMELTDYNYYGLQRMLRIRGTTLQKDENELLQGVYKAVIDSVHSRLDADKPIAFLLSGGVDSSLVAAISAKILGRPIRTFCCGMNQGTDLVYARKVAEWIGSEHTEVMFTEKEGLDAIKDVIRTVESWDTTTVRASVVQYLVSKWIGEKTDCKVLLVGEGPDEVCSSYLFNWYAPCGDALHNCAVEYIDKIHLFDGRRSDRCVSRWGLETRVPYLDPQFIREYWKIPSEWRMPTYKGIEKWWLRKAFEESGILPNEVLWRKKEAQSDGVSSKEKSWFQIIQEWVTDKISDKELVEAKTKYPHCTPQTKEALYYRKIFVELFGENRQNIIPHYWQPKWSADGKEITEYIDPSARVLDVYNN